jgi:predicted ATP-grasp superfamily ATP-dependent carboligase
MTSVNPAIVIGGGANALGITRNLSALGIPVYCLTGNPQAITPYSVHCHGLIRVPNVETDPQVLQQALQHLARRFHVPGVVFPTTDTALLTVSRIREAIPEYVAVIPSPEIVEIMVLKDRFYQSLDAHGVPHPRTLDPDAVDADTITRTLGFPVFLRPQQSLLFHERLGGKGFVAANMQELHHYLRVMQRADVHAMVQEIIPGSLTTGFTMWGYLDQASHLNVVIVTQTVHQPRMFANACIIRSVPRLWIRDFEPALLHYFQAIHYHGLFGAEFKRDARDGGFKLLEVNARSMSGNAMALSCGVNHILAAYHDTLGHPMAPQLQYHSGVYHIDSLVALPTLLVRAMHGQAHLRDLQPYRHRPHWHIWSRNDSLPWLQAIRHALPRLPRVIRA